MRAKYDSILGCMRELDPGSESIQSRLGTYIGRVDLSNGGAGDLSKVLITDIPAGDVIVESVDVTTGGLSSFVYAGLGSTLPTPEFCADPTFDTPGLWTLPAEAVISGGLLTVTLAPATEVLVPVPSVEPSAETSLAVNFTFISTVDSGPGDLILILTDDPKMSFYSDTGGAVVLSVMSVKRLENTVFDGLNAMPFEISRPNAISTRGTLFINSFKSLTVYPCITGTYYSSDASGAGTSGGSTGGYGWLGGRKADTLVIESTGTIATGYLDIWVRDRP